MKINYALSMCHSGPTIQNNHLNSCRNCIYYKPSAYNEFASELNRCYKFGKKNIITDEITYDFVEFARRDKNKCGEEGKYFEEEQNIQLKRMKHTIRRNLPYAIICILPFVLLFIQSLLLHKSI